MALSESQLLVNHFAKAHNVNLDKKGYIMQLSIAKSLIKKYNKPTIDLLIDYTSVFVKQRIYSLKYFEYILEETLPKAYAWKKKEEEKLVNSFNEVEVKQIDNVSKSKKVIKVGKF